MRRLRTDPTWLPTCKKPTCMTRTPQRTGFDANLSKDDLNDNHATPSAERMGYYGVILRAVERGGMRVYEIVLGHRKEGFSRIFASYDDDEHLVADWRSLGEELQLPLYILTAQGTLECATIAPAPNTRQRRFGSPLSGRRPRFLMRRRQGQPSLMGILHPVAMLGVSRS